MELERDDTGQFPLRDLIVSEFGRDQAIDLQGDLVALGNDVVIVPVFVLDLGLDFFGIADFTDHFWFVIVANYGFFAALGQDAAKAFAVKDSGIRFARFKIPLIAADHPLVVFHFEAAVLDA